MPRYDNAGNTCVRPHNTLTKINTGRVACASLVSHVKYAPRALPINVGKKDETDRRTDGRTDRRTPDRRIALMPVLQLR